MEVTPDANHLEGQGVIGLGPAPNSEILLAIGDASGNPPLNRIFSQNMTTLNYLSILLGRSDDSTNPFPGDLTIGEALAGYEDILAQPKLDVTVLTGSATSNQHWLTLLDADGIIGPDGAVIPVASQVQGTPDKTRATVMFDTGYTLPQVPKYVTASFASGCTNYETS